MEIGRIEREREAEREEEEEENMYLRYVCVIIEVSKMIYTW